ncbi:hypothetical protein LF841_18145, partial [Pseudomonas aeruginosa]
AHSFPTRRSSGPGRSLSPAAAVFVERVLEQDRRFAAT